MTERGDGVLLLHGRAQRRALAPLFPDTGDTLCNACLQGHKGEAVVTPGGESGALVSGDFIFLGGKASAAVVAWLAREATGYRILSGDAAWRALCARAGRPYRAETRWAFDVPARFPTQKLQALSHALPAGVTLSDMTEALFAQCANSAHLRDLVSAFPTFAAFASRGAGVLAVLAGAVIAGASAYAYDDEGIEIEVDTLPAHRQRGLATACGAALILRCQQRGLRPHWDAANAYSARLAQKLGYPPPVPYEVIEWTA